MARKSRRLDPASKPELEREPIVPDRIDDITEVAVFLVFLEHHDPTAMWGSRRIKDVVNAFARLQGMNSEFLRTQLLKEFEEDDN